MGASAEVLAQDDQIFDGPPILRLMLCRKIQDNPGRLKCFDEAFDSVAKAPAPAGRATGNAIPQEWQITESRSPVDDSPQVSALLFAHAPTVAGIVFRCKEREIEGVFRPERFIGTSTNGIQGLYRLNAGKPVEVRWVASTDGRAAFFNNPAAFLKMLPDDGTLFVRVLDFRGTPHDASFSLGKMSEVRAKVETACAFAKPPAKSSKTQ